MSWKLRINWLSHYGLKIQFPWLGRILDFPERTRFLPLKCILGWSYSTFPLLLRGQRLGFLLLNMLRLMEQRNGRIVLLVILWIKKLPYLFVRSIAFRIWGKYGLKDVLSNEKGFFFFQFGAEGAYRQISEVGAWHFGNRLMVLQEWHPDLDNLSYRFLLNKTYLGSNSEQISQVSMVFSCLVHW